MDSQGVNKRKIINDPVYGFINFPFDFLYDLIDHPYVQRLRRIKQLGFTQYVYPGATHTRFQHAIGAAHLMNQAIYILRQKGVEISEVEAESVLIAILLHDIGHGPFSHSLEMTIIKSLSHENISALLMEQLNHQYNGKLVLAIDIFNNKYKKRFLHQLVSSQLDMDRLDYLKRDSFFTGVTEGVIGSDRIIKMLNVVNDNLVLEAKGIYSIEKFLIARRLMYWQVYFHKTVVAADTLLIKTLRRAKEIAEKGKEIYASPSFKFFLMNKISEKKLNENKNEIINHYLLLDDDDIMVSAKSWMNHNDKVLSTLAYNLINRVLPKIKIQKIPFSKNQITELKKSICANNNWNKKEAEYFLSKGYIINNAYSENDHKIQVLFNNGKVEDIAEASDMFNVNNIYKIVKKYFICYPKNCRVIE